MTDRTPLRDPNRGYKSWLLSELWPVGPYLPNVDDSVRDWDTGEYRVISVNYTDATFVLEPWKVVLSSGITEEDTLLGVSSVVQNELFRLFIDKSKLPHVIEINRRVKWHGSDSRAVKLFKGRDTSVHGKVIGFIRDSAGEPISENIPLEPLLAYDATKTNISVMVTAYTTEDLVNDDVVTAVSYNEHGTPLEKKILLVQETTLARRLDESAMYITGIEVLTAYNDSVNENLIRLPINIGVESANFIGRVHYSNRPYVDWPINNDNGRFRLLNLQEYQGLFEGHSTTVTAVYQMSSDERSTLQNATPNHSVTRSYSLVTGSVENVYNAKIFAVAQWMNDIVGYKLNFYLYFLDRQISYLIPSSKLTINNGNGYNGSEFGRIQRLRLAVTLKDIDPRFSSHRHVQDIDVLFVTPPTQTLDTFVKVNYTPGYSDGYGQGIYGRSEMVDGGAWTVNLSSGITDRDVWLNRMFYKALPLYNEASESKAPEPTHFVLSIGVRSYEFDIGSWDTDLLITTALPTGTCIDIRWICRLESTTLDLARTSVVVVQ